MVRTIIKPSTPRINLSIPAEYIGKEVEVLVFPVKSSVNPQEATNGLEEHYTRKQQAFERFMRYRGTLPADFDYKKELTEYRDERYGHIN